jgi:hypothetical protein
VEVERAVATGTGLGERFALLVARLELQKGRARLLKCSRPRMRAGMAIYLLGGNTPLEVVKSIHHRSGIF